MEDFLGRELKLNDEVYWNDAVTGKVKDVALVYKIVRITCNNLVVIPESTSLFGDKEIILSPESVMKVDDNHYKEYLEYRGLIDDYVKWNNNYNKLNRNG